MGSAVEQGSEYGARSSQQGVQGDETEDLYDLLLTVKVAFTYLEEIDFELISSQRNYPEVQGVSVGAILSNYQRVRVEHV